MEWLKPLQLPKEREELSMIKVAYVNNSGKRQFIDMLNKDKNVTSIHTAIDSCGVWKITYNKKHDKAL